MSQVSPPKPWERAGNSAPRNTSGISSTTTIATPPTSTSTSTSSSSSAPALPSRPSTLTSVVNRTASNYTTNGAMNTNSIINPTSALSNPYGTSPYGGVGGYSSYSSPYSRLGGYGGAGMYGGGGMYGAGGMYGGGMYGRGMYGNGMNGMPGDPNNGGLTNNFAQSTQATFQIIESIVGAFGGFAQMLESTYMATHSSFFAMVSVAEQFGSLRQTLGQVLGIYTLMRWTRTLLARLTGRPPPADATALTPSNFFAFANGGSTNSIDPNNPKPPRPSKKPFIVFLLAVFGLPYLMGKLIRALAKSQEASILQQQQQQQQLQQGGGLNNPNGGLDPSKLDFCRVLYSFPPQEALANGTFDPQIDLEVKKGDLVAVLDKSDISSGGAAQEGEGSWWRCRARDGRMGWLPAVYLETIQRRPQTQALIEGSDGAGSRANSMPTSVTPASAVGKGDLSRAQTMDGSRAQTMASSVVSSGKGGVEVGSGTVLEGFQKGWPNDR